MVFSSKRCWVLTKYHLRKNKSTLFFHIFFSILILSGFVVSLFIVRRPQDKYIHPNTKKLKLKKDLVPIFFTYNMDLVSYPYLNKLVELTSKRILADTGIESEYFEFNTSLFGPSNILDIIKQTHQEVIFGFGYDGFSLDKNEITIRTREPNKFRDFNEDYLIATELFIEASADYNATINYAGLTVTTLRTRLVIVCVFFIIFIFIGPHISVYILLKDEPKGIRQYLLICGVSDVEYWISRFIGDTIPAFVITVLSVSLYAAFGYLYIFEHFGYYLYTVVFGYLGCYFWTNAVFALFHTTIPSILTLILDFIVFLVVVILHIVGDSVESIYTSLKWFGAVFPPCNMMNTVVLLGEYTGNNQEFHQTSIISLGFITAPIHVVVALSIFIGSEALRLYLPMKSAKKDYSEVRRLLNTSYDPPVATTEALEFAQMLEEDSSEEYVIKLLGISKCFRNLVGKQHLAVNNVSIGVKEGTIFGFLGTNGAGKSTIINMITSNLAASNGHIYICGKEVTMVNRSKMISICPQTNDHLDGNLTPSQLIDFFGQLNGVSYSEIERAHTDFLNKLGIEDQKDTKYKDLGSSAQRKVCIIVAHLSNAPIIILDEPTSSLDPVARTNVHELMYFFKEIKTYMISTHLLDEAEHICDFISMLVDGHVYTVGTPHYLMAKFGCSYRFDILMADTTGTTEVIEAYIASELPDAELKVTNPRVLEYSIPSGSAPLSTVCRVLQRAKAQFDTIELFTCTSSTLEKVFFRMVNGRED